MCNYFRVLALTNAGMCKGKQKKNGVSPRLPAFDAKLSGVGQQTPPCKMRSGVSDKNTGKLMPESSEFFVVNYFNS